ncbi:hypothetical protein FFK22_038020 [Mycobacterium sp. KBS0706]|uniref:hypothetical protein n=1 Tax=Mycobacterium sp. KBS0706 TaxID=2578109 RepID=UPI00110F8A43|nr:hypothetical protein [Mycobacterium sp. KBS0706]TSD83390.1 hypothetical protein FFK22_038020 [Mycobacterium sp. KBS0706]
MKSTVAIIGVATAGVIGLTLGAVLSPGGTALADPVNANAVHAAPSYAMPWGPGGLSGPGGPDKPGPGWGRRPDFRMKLARDLAGLETLIGIRADQLDAWRDYTSALLAVAEPPRPTMPPADGKGPEAFAPAERLADAAIARGDAAATLKSAITVLRDRLSPEQIALLQQAERHMGPPPPFPGPGPQDQRFGPPAERPVPHAG